MSEGEEGFNDSEQEQSPEKDSANESNKDDEERS